MFLTDLQLAKFKVLGAIIGKNVKIDELARINNPETFKIDDYSRIDFNCILSGNIDIGKYNHIAPLVSISAMHPDTIFQTGFNCNLSAHSRVYTSDADYTKGAGLTNPTIPIKFRSNRHGSVIMKDYVMCGANTTILPGTILPEGFNSGVGCVLKGNDYEPYSLYAIDNRPKLLRKIDKNAKKNMRKRLEDETK